MTQRIYYPPRGEAPEPAPRPTIAERLAAVGIADINDAALQACRMAHFICWASDIWDKFETARAAAVECLYTSDAIPTVREMAVSGMEAIGRMAYAESAHNGYDLSRHRVRPTFEKYWQWASQPTGSPEHRVVESTALWQIWDQLGPLQQQTLRAVAEHDTYEQAADAEGCGYDAFIRRVKVAREQFYALWHEGETPSRLWSRNRKVGKRGEAPRGRRDSAVYGIRRRATLPEITSKEAA